MSPRSIRLRSAVAAACALTLLSACNRSSDAGADGRTGSTPGATNSRPGTTSGSSTSGGSMSSGSTTSSSTGNTGAGTTAGATGGSTAADMPSVSSTASASASGAAGSRTAAMSGAALVGDDAKFVKAAAEGGLYEVAVGKLAADKASNPDVRSYGSMLAEHHSAANDKLQQVVSAHAVTLPTSVPADKQKKIDRLSQLSGAAFDRQFIEMVGIEDHRKDIADFQKASKSAKADDIRAFASETLPTLQSHFDAAQKLKTGGAKKTSNS